MPKLKKSKLDNIVSDREWLNELISLEREPRPSRIFFTGSARELCDRGITILGSQEYLSPAKSWRCKLWDTSIIEATDWHSDEFWPTLLRDMIDAGVLDCVDFSELCRLWTLVIGKHAVENKDLGKAAVDAWAKWKHIGLQKRTGLQK